MSVMNALDFNNEVFRGFITWGGLLLIKMLLMSLLTGVQRFRKGAYANPEDIGVRPNSEVKQDEDVERVRRAHLNDLENIPAFLIAGLFFVCSEPNVDLALWLFRIAVLVRIVHTIAVANPEDCALSKNFEVKTHEDVERCRRAHLNDLENVIPFLIIGLFFIFTEPHKTVASWLVRIIGVTRILHSIFYAVYPVRQPTRAILHYISYIINLYMCLSVVVYFFKI
ncbi:CLUMA_CG009938, isoform A [Clunio marinus]|uniref:Microsomal glutathione S-transferase 1 n=1 Tax=Clunio marinus TaxID=568069 RepID=A0A1J1IEB2_9DIPT|nr:CLUMA_CG009938, isoform A [Clunio marinus]